VILEASRRPLSDLEIKKAKKQMKVSVLEGVRTAHGLATLIGNVLTINPNLEYLNRDFEGYDRVTQHSLQRVLNQYLTPLRKNRVSLLPLSGETP
jgi:predicted Zn-dependent peptidase